MDSEKDFDEKKYQLELKKLQQARLDTWMRFVSTVLIAGALTAAIQWYGIREQNQARILAQEAQRAQTLIKLANAREAAATDLRAQMFQALLQNYFKQVNQRERIAILELIGLNFRDAVLIKPMFELIDKELRNGNELPQKETYELLDILHGAARSIVQDQLNQIQQSIHGTVCELELKIDQWQEPQCFPLLSLKLAKIISSNQNEGLTNTIDQLIPPNQIEVMTNTKDYLFLGDDKKEDGDKFNVSYYDMPMVDYTLAMDDPREPWKYSVVLREVFPKEAKAKIAVAILPDDSFSMDYRYAFDEMLSKLLKPEEQVETSASH